MSGHASEGELGRLHALDASVTDDGERTLDEIRAHVDSCDECATRLDELRSLDDLATSVQRVARGAGDPLSINGYEIEGEIHRGGQGIVYRAVQRSTGRRVALKVVLRGTLASDRQRARFEREIELASRIDHPNVVAIIDRGETGDGRAFLVMELVDGVTLDHAMDGAGWSVDRRLRVFLEVCAGVRAAHQRGVLHRDLKPGNVVVDTNGRVKVLDFGLAKDDLGASVTAARTMSGEFMGTLAYASPEQLGGDPSRIDARTDVYALGVMLYELLTGSLPHDVRGPVQDVIKRVLGETPARPRSIDPKLDPDLDVVALTALEQDPTRRYQSVEALEDDVRAVLGHQPIRAKQASTMGRVRKFVRRNRAGVALSGVIVLGMCTTIGALTAGIVRTRAAMELAEERRSQAQSELDKQMLVSGFFRELLSEVDPGESGPDMRVSDLLDVASERIGDRFAQYPDLRGALGRTVGETYARLGVYAPSEAQLVGAIDAMESQDPVPKAPLAGALGVLARVQTATTRLDEADATLQRAIGIAESLGDDPESIELRAGLAHQLGAQRFERGEFESSIRAYDESIGMLGGMEHESARRVLAQAMIGKGVSLKRLERFDEALGVYDGALEILREVRRENHPDTLAALSNRAEVLYNLGRVDEAEAAHRDLLQRRREVFGSTHERVGITLNNLADLMRERGAFDDAGAMFDEAIAIFRENPGDPSLRLAITIHNAGVMHLERGEDHDRASAMLEEAATMSASLLPDGHWIPAQFSVKWAECLMIQGFERRATFMLNEARPDLVRSLGEDHRRVAHVDELLSRVGS
jgi:tetratricopeptide (TPR) repeat protein/predicted Ser/Thr protein kinase